MGINIRTKGASGEREVCKILVEHGLVNEASRNLDQVREGGSDVEVLSGVSIEVKRQERLAIKTWWDQVTLSASKMGKVPAVWWRPNRAKWLIMLPAGAIPGERVQVGSEKVGRVPNYALYPHLQFVTVEVFVNWYKLSYCGKVCIRCGVFEPYKEYYTSHKTEDGYTKSCKLCAELGV